MNKQSNLYIIIYSTVLVVIVAAILSYTSIELRPLQDRNVEIAKKGDILRSVGLLNVEEGEDKTVVIENDYKQYIKEIFLVRPNGEIVQDADEVKAFNVFINLDREYFKGKPTEDSQLPVFLSVDDSGVSRYIFPVRGTGLWGPIWGYVALGEDLKTIIGVVFDHTSETPGLGAEISAAPFQDQFIGKQIYKGSNYVGIGMLKGAGSSKGNVHAVDAVSGGTITSNAVRDMLDNSLGGYEIYLRAKREGSATNENKELTE